MVGTINRHPGTSAPLGRKSSPTDLRNRAREEAPPSAGLGSATGYRSGILRFLVYVRDHLAAEARSRVTSRSSFWARRETPATGESPGINGLSWHGRYASQRHQQRTQQCVSGHEALSSTSSLGASGMLGAASQRAYVQLDPTSATHRSGGCSQGATSSESASSQTPLGVSGSSSATTAPLGDTPSPPQRTCGAKHGSKREKSCLFRAKLALRERRFRRTRLDQGKRPLPAGHPGGHLKCSVSVRLSGQVQTLDQTRPGRQFDASGATIRPGERRRFPKLAGVQSARY